MELNEILHRRCSVHNYLSTPVEPEKLTAILNAARLAPTGKNSQPQRLLVVQSREGMEKIARVTHTPNAYTAPCAILVCTDTAVSWTRPYDGYNIHAIDASIVTTYLCLAATELQLGSLWVERFDPILVREEFSLPDAWSPDAILCLGLPAPDALKPTDRYETERLPLEETVFYEHF